jgi:hypothetical protein
MTLHRLSIRKDDLSAAAAAQHDGRHVAVPASHQMKGTQCLIGTLQQKQQVWECEFDTCEWQLQGVQGSVWGRV